MTAYRDFTSEQLQAELDTLWQQYNAFTMRNLSLNMARGKPSPQQLDLSLPMLDVLPANIEASNYNAGAADDLRNYGGLTGIPEAKELMGAIMDVPANNVIIGGNSSLQLMYNTISAAMTHGILGSTPWAKLDGQVKFLCPSPGYDRHFAITEHFGIKMIPVPLHPEGPDMYVVERYVNTDPMIKGIWCVPKFSNPTGAVYSLDTAQQLARLFPAADDFRIYWDNAYAVHDFYAEKPTDSAAQNTVGLPNIKQVCEQNGNPDIWYQFASTSKITFAGAGISALASSDGNIKCIEEQLSYQTIGNDKLNQKRHVLFLRDLDGVREHMKKHSAIIKPKFDCVLETLEAGLRKYRIGEWSTPKGGYFISFQGPPNTAKRTVELAGNAGVTLTPAGATYPYGNDPYDSNIRIAPTYPSPDDLQLASEILVVCVRIATLEQIISRR
ncbi:putative aminotransferase [Actinomycetota bacterium]|nr:putative aminotransferase [Actinomycetota bacterium]